MISSEEATGPASLFTFSYALKIFTRDEVVTGFRLTQDSYPDQKGFSGIQKLYQNVSSKYAA